MNAIRVAGVLLALSVLAGCGNNSTTASASESGTSTQSRPATFAEPRVTWAQGSTLHYGSDTMRLPGDAAPGLWRTPYGFIVTLKKGSGEGGGEVTFFDGRRAKALPGDPVGVAVSPDGRYAGWIDYAGPDRPQSRPAEVVVVDLKTGTEVMRNHDDMGGPDDDLSALYEDGGQGFRGFDDTYVYWATPKGEHTIHRARIGTWKPEPAEGVGSMPSARPYDTLSGFAAKGGLDGVASPDRRWCVTTGEPGRLPVVACRTARRVTPAYPARKNYFGGWTGPDRFAAGSAATDVPPVSAGGPAVPGRVVECTLPSGPCRQVARVDDLSSVVFATGPEQSKG